MTWTISQVGCLELLWHLMGFTQNGTWNRNNELWCLNAHQEMSHLCIWILFSAFVKTRNPATMQLICSFTFVSHNCLISFHMAICPGLEMFGTLSYQNSGWFENNLQAWLIHIPNTSWFNDNICIPDKKKFSCFYNWHWCRTVDVPSSLRRTNFWCRSLNDRQHLSDGFLFLNLTWYFCPRPEAYLN